MGLIVGMTGVGGGSLMTPILVLKFSVEPMVAVGTDLLYAAITKSTGIFVHHAKKNIDWSIVKYLCIGSIPATVMSIMALKGMMATDIDHGAIITATLGGALVLTSLVIFFKSSIHNFAESPKLTRIKALHLRFRTPLTILSGVFIGFLVTMSSVGAGALGAALLYFLYPKMRTIMIVGTDLAHAVPLTAIAGIGHAHLGTIDYALLFNLLLGSIPGIYLGGSIGSYLPEKIVRFSLASLLLLIGLHLVIF